MHCRYARFGADIRKRYFVDPALIGSALRLDTAGVLRDGDLLGRTLDTFVMAQIRPEAEVSAMRPRLYHLRDMGGRREIDVFGETGTGVIAATLTESPKWNVLRRIQAALCRDTCIPVLIDLATFIGVHVKKSRMCG